MSGYYPLSAAALEAHWSSLTVPCPSGPDVPLIDPRPVAFFPASITLAKAPTETVNWISGRPAVTIVWNPNTCGSENWSTIGMLVRGATLDGQSRIVLEAGVVASDLNLVNTNGDGTFQDDSWGPDDSTVSSAWAEPLKRWKQGLLRAAKSKP